MRITALQKLVGIAIAIAMIYQVGDYYRVFGEEPLVELHGSVRLEGRPLTKGTVHFVPIDPEQNRGAGGTITNGEYVVPQRFGLPRGRYQVQVSSIRSDEAARAIDARNKGEDVPELTEQVPERYNLKSEIYVDLTKGNLIEMDLDLKQ